jgi:nucleotide-binding universal stress UspA family protein
VRISSSTSSTAAPFWTRYLRSEDPEFAGVSFEDEVVGGSPDEKLVDVAQVHDADEIAVGSHGHGGLRAMIGSVAHGLLHLADRPVVVIPRSYVEARRGRA